MDGARLAWVPSGICMQLLLATITVIAFRPNIPDDLTNQIDHQIPRSDFPFSLNTATTISVTVIGRWGCSRFTLSDDISIRSPFFGIPSDRTGCHQDWFFLQRFPPIYRISVAPNCNVECRSNWWLNLTNFTLLLLDTIVEFLYSIVDLLPTETYRTNDFLKHFLFVYKRWLFCIT